jgi:pimeloyl-ACP methyl ester carboxylesterase
MTPIVFFHGNSFPAGTYRVLFKHLRARGFSVRAIEKLGHDPRHPVDNNWRGLVEQVAEFTQAQVDKLGQPVWMVGHSLGGILSLMAAARHPDMARGVVLLDSPIVGGWRSKALGMIKGAQLVGAVSPGAVSHKRRNSWPSAEAAYAHFRHKKAFAQWSDDVLNDYIEHGTVEQDGKRVLAFDRAIETQIYNTIPDNLDRLFKRHPLKCPVSFIGGRQSAEMRMVGMSMTDQLTKGRTMMLDGSHLFPMEKPLTAAAAIEASLRNMGA